MNIDEQPEVAPAAAEVPQEPTSKEENITSPKSESSATAVADSTTPVSVSQEPPKPKLCGICEKQAGKYKCPHCTFPYCSVSCFQSHKENHPPDPPAPPKEPPKTVDTAKIKKREHPFSALDNSPELRRLFEKYPRLPAKLLLIDRTTLPPVDEPTGGLPWSLQQAPGYQPKRAKWTHDTGLKRGKEALRKARTDPGEDGDAVREYCELVIYLLSKTKENDVIDMVRQEVTQEDMKLIEQMIEAEGQDRG